MSDFWHTFFIVGGREQEICHCGVGKICRMQIDRRSLVFGLSVVLIERCVEWSWLRSRSVRTNYEVQEARYELLVRQKESTSLASQEQGHRLGQTAAVVQLAAAAVELARLNLSYTVILAPCDGTLGRKNVQEGQLIQPGQPIVDIVDANEIWVMANYKETQTANIAVGNEVEFEVDAVPGVVYKGYVEKISRATGASFSLLPQDNSSGNFVKIEQRIPVRIAFSEDNSAEDMARLRSGMNVECSVKMRNEE